MENPSTPSIGNSVTTQPQGDAVQQWKAAVRALRQVVIKQQVELIQARDQLNMIRGSEDPKESLLAIVNASPNGIAFQSIKGVSDPTADLAAARDELVREGKITAGDKKRGMILFPVKPTAQVTEATAQ